MLTQQFVKKSPIVLISTFVIASLLSGSCLADDEGKEYKSCKQLRKLDTENAITIAAAKLYIEHNATDEDTGVHGAFDDHGYSQLCVYNPKGKAVLSVSPQGKFKDLMMAGIFFQSREPPNTEYSIENLKSDFPEGAYKVRGINYDGRAVVGTAYFTHAIPVAPQITYPQEDAEVSANNLTVSWEHVTQSLDAAAVDITGYQVIITKEVENDPNGFSRPTYDVHVAASQNTLSVPNEFLEPGVEYELEVLALERSGNQTISVSFFTVE